MAISCKIDLHDWIYSIEYFDVYYLGIYFNTVKKEVKTCRNCNKKIVCY